MNIDETQAVETMRSWLLDAVDFKDEPQNMELLDSYVVVWPRDNDKQQAHLVRFEMKSGFIGVGLTGPVTWCFVGEVPFDAMDTDLILLLYLGWYIMFLVQKAERYQDPVDFNNKLDVYRILEIYGVSEMREVDKFAFIDSMYYEIRGVYDSKPCRIVSQDNDYLFINAEDIPDLIPALYWVLGSQYLQNFAEQDSGPFVAL